MKLYTDFDFINEKTLVPDARLAISAEEVKTVYRAVEQVNQWAETSIYASCFQPLYVLLTDCPGDNSFASVDGEAFTQQVFIEYNVYSIIFEFTNGSCLKNLIFREPPTLFDFAAFFLLHELGHVVHFHLLLPALKTPFEKLASYHDRFLPYHLTLESKYPLSAFTHNHKQLQQAYRNIPSEQFSDRFAHQSLLSIKQT